MLLRGIIKFVRFEFIKRHLFLSNNNIYYDTFSSFSRFRSNFLFNIFRKFELNLSRPSHKNKLYYAYRFIAESQYYIHHVFVFIILVYDMIFNNFILEHMFTILPFIFIYNIWILLCKFDNGLNPLADNILYHFFYSSSSMLDNDHMQLGPLTIETNTMKRIYMFYIKTDLVYDYELEKYYDDPDNYVRKETITDKIYQRYLKIKEWLIEIFINPLK
jgi:hypothetical protein